MAADVLRRLLPLGVLVSLFSATQAAKTVKYDFNITWVTTNPDGMFDRPTMGINGEWPIPRIEAEVGDQVVVNVLNQLGNQSTSLHFHGLFMNGTAHMDGPVQVSQCAIPPGSSFTYNFTIRQPGTYWYHSHTRGQYPDGLRGPLIIHDPKSPFKDQYDEELVLTVSDWYHDQMPDLLKGFISKGNPTGAEPVPNAALFNDTQDLKVAIQPNKTYLFRMVNMGAFAGQYIWFEGHNMTIVEVDGVYHEPAEAQMIYLSAAQRCSFMITTKNDTAANFPFMASMDTDLFDVLPDDLDYNVTGWLVYDDTKEFPDAAIVDEFDEFDDMELVPHDNLTLFGEPDQTIELDVIMDNLGDGGNYAFFNDISYKAPKVPSLYTVLSSGDQASNPQIYGSHTHSFVLEKDQIVQIVVNNIDPGKHPFHLHGHNFQTIYRSDDEAGTFADSNITDADFAPTPMRRDTIVLKPDGFLILRFKADNPGVWLFHCHIEWHVTSGLMATIVEAPMDLQKDLKIPKDHYNACAAGGVPTQGNAAGNTADLLDLNGEPAPPARLPEGFTTKGIVALVFSCIAGILGVAVVAWYGFAAPTPTLYEDAGERIAESGAPSSGAATHGATGTGAREEVAATTGGGSGAARA